MTKVCDVRNFPGPDADDYAYGVWSALSDVYGIAAPVDLARVHEAVLGMRERERRRTFEDALQLRDELVRLLALVG